MRQIVLDTETTGLEPDLGHRIIEIGCVEMINRRPTRRHYHQFLNPEREIEEGALAVHGIDSEFLADKPRFADIARDFLEFIKGGELIIHNAAFDVAFLNAELARLGPEWGKIEDYCRVTDTVALAREKHPGQKASLDALCKRYNVDNSARTLHGALLDAEILLDVYLAMTGGQAALSLSDDNGAALGNSRGTRGAAIARPPLRVIRPTAEEQAAHRRRLEAIEAGSGGRCVWLRLDRETGSEG
jgi:DNA polymerase-3 subunit epsilon